MMTVALVVVAVLVVAALVAAAGGMDTRRTVRRTRVVAPAVERVVQRPAGRVVVERRVVD
jgi:hypothetical protein